MPKPTKDVSKIRSRSIAAIGASVVLFLGVFAVGLYNWQGHEGSNLAPIMLGIGTVAVILMVIGLGMMQQVRRLDSGEELPDVDYRHTYRLLVAIGLIVTAAAVARHMLIPPTFGKLGHYRSATLTVERSRAPRYQGTPACAKCHADKAKLLSKDAHSRAQCETCHGPGRQHVADPEKHKPTKPDGKSSCLVCHKQLNARPTSFAQIDVEQHFKLVGVREPKTRCVACHSPHEPLFMDRDIRKARLHPIVHRCRDCHRGRTNEQLERPKTHPPIFQCQYCHKAKVADFKTRKHKRLQCTTCHKFFKVTEFAGRIIRDADPRFCLLCHKKASFRRAGGPPTIDWAKHKKEQADGENISCVTCHRDKFHGDKPDKPAAQPAPMDAPAAQPSPMDAPAARPAPMTAARPAPMTAARPRPNPRPAPMVKKP